MSRSYKKFPLIKVKSRYNQKKAAKRCRKVYVIDGNYYKKTFERWDITDFKSRCSFKEYLIHHSEYKENLDIEHQYLNYDENQCGSVKIAELFLDIDGIFKLKDKYYNKETKKYYKCTELKHKISYKSIDETILNKLYDEWSGWYRRK